MLLAGAPEPAQAAVLETFEAVGEKIHHFRNGKSCKAWLVANVRNRLLKNANEPAAESAREPDGSVPPPGADLNPQAFELASRFCKIPEPGRSALALLYLEHFSAQEIAQILQLSMDEFADAVDSARTLLRQMEAVQRATSPAERREP